LYVLRVERVRAWRPAVPGVDEVFHARFVEHRYPPHVHDTWTLLVVDDGAIRFDLDRRGHGAGAAAVSLLPPGVVHDGRAAVDAGFRKRVAYVSLDVVGADLVGRAVDRPVWDDGSLHAAVDLLHRRLAVPGEELAAEHSLHLVATALRARLLGRPAAPIRVHAGVADDAREVLDERALGAVTLADVADVVGVGVPHLARSFRARHGITAHAYVVARRVEAARRLLLDGTPPAAAAAAAGFYDQAHLTRVFRRHTGTTPAAFARAA
jgi:AraC-like DNA-binding protein